MSAPAIESPTAADVLRGALTELRRDLNVDGNGWAQNRFGWGDDCKCAIGALNFTVDRIATQTGCDLMDSDLAARYALCEAAKGCDFPGGPSSAIIRWNDTPGRTFSEVEAAFERAIELAEAGAR